MIKLHFDGLYRSNWYREQHNKLPQDIMCYGWLIEKNSRTIARGHGGLLYPRGASSNCAEYIALIEGMEALRDLNIRSEEIWIYGDAKSVIDQMSGESKVSSDAVKPLHQRAIRLSRWFEDLHWLWSPRRQNRDADQLTRRALKQIRLSREYHSLPEGRIGKRGMVPLLDLRMIQGGLLAS
jgi:ribonuclease HI